MTIPLQFVSLYGGQEVFVWSTRLLDLGTDFLVGNMVATCILTCIKVTNYNACVELCCQCPTTGVVETSWF